MSGEKEAAICREGGQATHAQYGDSNSQLGLEFHCQISFIYTWRPMKYFLNSYLFALKSTLVISLDPKRKIKFPLGKIFNESVKYFLLLKFNYKLTYYIINKKIIIIKFRKKRIN